MARRSDHSPEELRELALAAAATVVERQGPAALTARAVAKVIGYSPGTLYNVFANLDDLTLQMNGRTLETLERELAAAPLGIGAEADLHALARIYVGFLEAHPGLWDMLFQHRLPAGTPLPGWYQARIERLLARAETAMAPLFAPSASERRHEAARVLWASLHGICSLAISGKLEAVGTASATTMIRLLVSTFVAGLERGTAEGDPSCRGT